jgi:FMN phosphatase YigB (HAD superfamily)
MRKKTVLITDLDNTLFDWFDLWYHPFKAMLDVILERSGVEKEALLREIKSIHQLHGTAEYHFLIEHLPSLKKLHPGIDLTELYADAISAYKAARNERMQLYPTVGESLLKIKSSGSLIVGYTESQLYYTQYRIKKLGLDGVIDCLFSSEDHALPVNANVQDLEVYQEENYRLTHTKHHITPAGEIKPNPDLLIDMIRRLEASEQDCVYIGDNLYKDVLMAKMVVLICGRNTSSFARSHIGQTKWWKKSEPLSMKA